MTGKGTSFPPSLPGFLIIGATLAVLAWLPSFLNSRSYRITLPEADINSTPAVFPLDQMLPVLSPATKNPELKTLQQFLNHYPAGILVNFWATWCPPCLEELPSLEALGRQLKAAGSSLPQLVTISADEKPGDVPKYLRTLSYGISFPILFDAGAGFSRTVGTTKYPETYWLDGKGLVRHKWVGPQNWMSREVLQVIQNRVE